MDREEGGVAVLAVLFMTSLVLSLALALEFACLYAQKSSFDNSLNIAREETFSPGFDMQLKSSPDPGGLICRKVVSSLRRNGYQGEITLWFYEATDEEIERANPIIDSAENVRCLAYHLVLEKGYQSAVVPAAWLAGAVISNGTTAAMCPYALLKTYKPEGVAGKVWRYSVAAGSTDAARQESTAPKTPGLSNAIKESLAKPTEIYRANQ